jgi:hypothetical protein
MSTFFSTLTTLFSPTEAMMTTRQLEPAKSDEHSSDHAKSDDASSVDTTTVKNRASRSNSALAMFSPFPEEDEKNRSVVEILEGKIFQLELDRFNLGFGEAASDVKVEEDTIKIKNVETRFRRVSLSESNYHVGWVVDGDVNNCMCCRTFFFLMSKYHCR